MKMRFLISSLLLALISLGSWADNGTTPDPDPEPTVEKEEVLIPTTPSTRPNAPSRIYIVCTYGAGYVRLGFPQGIYSATVTITNGEEEWFGFASIDEPVMETPVFSGDYTIECVADNGRLFTGTLHF